MPMNKIVDSNVFAQEVAEFDPLIEIRRLGLDEHVIRLENDGFTVVTPDQFDDHGLSARLFDRILEVSERETGIKPDFTGGNSHRDAKMATGQSKFYALRDGPMFEEALMHPVPQALASYLLGTNFLLSSFSTAVRGPGTPELVLHTDMLMIPPPFPFYPQIMTVFWALTDFTAEGGSTFFWPGSHKFCRRPTTAECEQRERFHSITAPAGSLLVWHGNTWHGGGEKQTDGLRVSMPMHFCRPYIIPQEDYQDMPAEAFERNPPRFAEMLRKGHPYPFAYPKPDFASLARLNAGAARLPG
jgi:hypothetical protein